MKHHQSRLLIFLMVLASSLWMVMTPSKVAAATCQWTGSVNTNWSTAGNWSACNGVTPQAADTAVIPNTINKPVISTAIFVSGIDIDAGASVTVANAGSLTLQGATTALEGTGNLIVAPGGVVNWTNGAISEAGGFTINADGTLTGTLNISAGGNKTLIGRTITNNGATVMNSSMTMSDGAVFQNQAGATFEMQSSASINASGAVASTFNNVGTFRKVTPSSSSTVSVALNNTGVVDVRGGTVRFGGGGTSTGPFYVANDSTLDLSGGTHFLQASTIIQGAGNVVFSGGSSNVAGSFDVEGSTSVSGATTFVTFTHPITDVGEVLAVSGGQANLNYSGNLTMTNISLTGGTLTGSTHITATDMLTWTGGTIAGSAITHIEGDATIAGNTSKTITSRTLSLNGHTVMSSTINVSAGTGVVFRNNVSGTFDIQTDVNFTVVGNGAVSTFYNEGTLIKTGGVSLAGAAINAVYINSGSTNVQVGKLLLRNGGTATGAFDVSSGATLEFSSGTYAFESGSEVTGAGTVAFTGGTITVDGAYAVAGTTAISGNMTTVTFRSVIDNVGSTLNISGGLANFAFTGAITPTTLLMSNGTLSGTVDVNVSGPLNWTGGTFQGPSGSTADINANGSLTISSAAAKSLNGRTLHNNVGGVMSGTISMVANTQAEVYNHAGVTFEILNDAGINSTGSGNLPAVRNEGTMRKIGSTGASSLLSVMTNTGTIDVISGTLSLRNTSNSTGGDFVVGAGATLEFNGGSHTLDATSSIVGAGTVNFVAGMATLVPGATYNVTGVTRVTGSNPVEMQGAVTSIGSRLDVTNGSVNFFTGAINPMTLTMSGGTIKGGATINVSDVFTWTSGTLGDSNGARGTTNVNGRLAIMGTGAKNMARHTLNNNLDGVMEGNVTMTAAAQIINPSGKGFRMQAGADINANNAGGNPGFINAGFFTKTASTDVSIMGAVFTNTGSVILEEGTLRLGNGGTATGTFHVLGSTTLEFAGISGVNGTPYVLAPQSSIVSDIGGQVTFTSGTVTVNGTYNNIDTTNVAGATVTFNTPVTDIGNILQVSNGTVDFNFAGMISPDLLRLQSGTLKGQANITISGMFDWSGGTLEGVTGSVANANGGITISGTAGKTLTRRTLNAAEDVVFAGTGNLTLSSGSYINNMAGNIFDIQGNVGIAAAGTPTSGFHNLGFVRKSSGTGTSSIGVPFTNTNSVEIQAGTLSMTGGGVSGGYYTTTLLSTLQFGGGTHVLSDTSVITGTGSVLFSAGTVTVTGQYHVEDRTSMSGGTAYLRTSNPTNLGALTQSNGTLDVTGNPNVVISGDINRTGGSIVGPGSLITFNKPGVQALSTTGLTTLGHIHVVSDTILSHQGAGNVTATGIDNDGVIRRILAVTSAGAKDLGLTGVSINVVTQGTLQEIQVDRIDSSAPLATGPTDTGRYWEISVLGSGYTVDVSLPHGLQYPLVSLVCHYEGSAWNCGRDTFNATMVTRNGITNLQGTWATGLICGDVVPPAPVDMLDIQSVSGLFGATPTSTGWVDAYDLNGNDQIDITDITIVAALWGSSC